MDRVVEENKKKYFICSDIHSFFDEWQEALRKKHFDINNPNHIIVICGDIFDRGTQPLEVYQFLRNLPRERRILIRGNHEILLDDLVRRGFAESHDRHNGTIDTLYYLQGLPGEDEHIHEFYRELAIRGVEYGSPVYRQIQLKYENEKRSIWNGLVKEILDWIYSDEWINYWETDNYIFVHSWIPTIQSYSFDKWGYPHLDGPEKFREDWKNATQTEWDDAMWGCPWKKALNKLNQTGKTIVCGHWHTSDFFNHLTKQHKQIYECPIFKSKRYKLIGLDACTAGSKKVNCLVLEEDEL